MVDNNLYEVWKRPAAQLNIPWPVTQDTDGAARDLYDGKRLSPTRPVAKQLLPAVLACMAQMSRFWSKPYKSKITTQGLSKLEVHSMTELELSVPPPVEPSVVHHPQPIHLCILTHY